MPCGDTGINVFRNDNVGLVGTGGLDPGDMRTAHLLSDVAGRPGIGELRNLSDTGEKLPSCVQTALCEGNVFLFQLQQEDLCTFLSLIHI